MPNWNQILDELKERGSVHDVIRRKYLASLHQLTNRNVIIYYSGWLQSPDRRVEFGITDYDKIGFMSACQGIDASLGLDLVLHTPGGETAATESLVDYLHQKFPSIRVIVPQLALSAGTMIACAADQIVMGKQSSLGPIDPQLNRVPAHGILEEFRQAYFEIQSDPNKVAVWQPIIAKYHPTLIGECQKVIRWSEEMVRRWLETGMFSRLPDAAIRAQRVIDLLASHEETLFHGRHYSAKQCEGIGLFVEMLEHSQDLQDAVLSVHHACMHTLASTPAYKIIENHKGVAFINSLKAIMMPGHG